MLAKVRTFALEGVDGVPVTVEVDVRRGLPAFSVVGLPDRAVRESRERVRAALANSGVNFPQQRVTVNLAPASLRKSGPSFDLAIAVAVVAASCRCRARSGRSGVRWRWHSPRDGAASGECSCPSQILQRPRLPTASR
jgi:magnesium chelatase family protein